MENLCHAALSLSPNQLQPLTVASARAGLPLAEDVRAGGVRGEAAAAGGGEGRGAAAVPVETEAARRPGVSGAQVCMCAALSGSCWAARVLGMSWCLPLAAWWMLSVSAIVYIGIVPSIFQPELQVTLRRGARTASILPPFHARGFGAAPWTPISLDGE